MGVGWVILKVLLCPIILPFQAIRQVQEMLPNSSSQGQLHILDFSSCRIYFVGCIIVYFERLMRGLLCVSFAVFALGVTPPTRVTIADSSDAYLAT